MSYLRCALASVVFLGACAESEPTATDDQAITGADGYRAIAPASGAVYQSIAVVGDVALVGDNQNRIDVVNLATMRKSGSIAGRIPADSLTTAGDQIIACGLRDDSPLDPFGHTPADRSYVLTVIDPASRHVAGEIKLHVEPFLASNPATGFVDLPDLSCRFDSPSRTMAVSFSQRELGREMVTFPLPALGATVEWTAIPGAKRTRIDAGGEATLKAAIESDGEITYAAGGWGLRRQAAGATRAKSLRDENREHLVDLARRGETIYAVDHSGGLLIVRASDGKTVERVEIPDFLHAIALAPSHVIVVGQAGLFVTKDRWTQRMP